MLENSVKYMFIFCKKYEMAEQVIVHRVRSIKLFLGVTIKYAHPILAKRRNSTKDNYLK